MNSYKAGDVGAHLEVEVGDGVGALAVGGRGRGVRHARQSLAHQLGDAADDAG